MTINILSLPLTENLPQPEKSSFIPEMCIKIFNHEYSALFDTGASVSARSKIFFKFLQKNFPKQNLPMLPITGITVSTALLGKNKKIHCDEIKKSKWWKTGGKLSESYVICMCLRLCCNLCVVDSF